MEIPIEEATDMFIGKTIEKMDATHCNQIEFLFTDGTKVALHIDAGIGLPNVMACDHCVEMV